MSKTSDPTFTEPGDQSTTGAELELVLCLELGRAGAGAGAGSVPSVQVRVGSVRGSLGGGV